MYKAGDKVYIERTAEVDVGFLAWAYVKNHLEGIVRYQMSFASLGVEKVRNMPIGEIVYAVEFPDEFTGGHTCQGTCADHRGQFIAGKHLDLKFEESREVQTVPNIEGYDDSDKYDDQEDPEL